MKWCTWCPYRTTNGTKKNYWPKWEEGRKVLGPSSSHEQLRDILLNNNTKRREIWKKIYHFPLKKPFYIKQRTLFVTVYFFIGKNPLCRLLFRGNVWRERGVLSLDRDTRGWVRKNKNVSINKKARIDAKRGSVIGGRRPDGASLWIQQKQSTTNAPRQEESVESTGNLASILVHSLKLNKRNVNNKRREAGGR